MIYIHTETNSTGMPFLLTRLCLDITNVFLLEKNNKKKSESKSNFAIYFMTKDRRRKTYPSKFLRDENMKLKSANNKKKLPGDTFNQ